MRGFESRRGHSPNNTSLTEFANSSSLVVEGQAIGVGHTEHLGDEWLTAIIEVAHIWASAPTDIAPDDTIEVGLFADNTTLGMTDDLAARFTPSPVIAFLAIDDDGFVSAAFEGWWQRCDDTVPATLFAPSQWNVTNPDELRQAAALAHPG